MISISSGFLDGSVWRVEVLVAGGLTVVLRVGLGVGLPFGVETEAAVAVAESPKAKARSWSFIFDNVEFCS